MTAADARRSLERLREYRDVVQALVPGAPAWWAISDADALASACFLSGLRRPVVVFEVGTFMGVSAFHFAGQPNVLAVVTVDPNPVIGDEFRSSVPFFEGAGITFDPRLFRDERRVLEIAESALARFPRAQQKIELREGTVAGSRPLVEGAAVATGARGDRLVPEPPPDAVLAAFIDGLHAEAGVKSDLETVFRAVPDAVAMLHDCRGGHAAAVRAGIDRFAAEAEREYAFRLFGQQGDGEELDLPVLPEPAGKGEPRFEEREVPNLGFVFAAGDRALEGVLREAEVLFRSLAPQVREGEEGEPTGS